MDKDNKTFYITTPIYYPSGKLHIGHSYTTVAADATARYKRMQGFDTMFLTGTDEHGQKIENKAREMGVTPKQYVDDIVSGIKDMWKLLNISYDRFIRTTDEYHERAVQAIFRRLYDSGDIYKGRYEGHYCTPCESFWTHTQLIDGKCPDCHRPVKQASEEAYFFRLSRYADRLEAYYESHPDFIQPVSRKNEMINNFIKPGLEDLCVSRTSFTWGVPVDFDDGHVVYVWVDALSNYITALGAFGEDDTDYRRYWPADAHLVGKEIVRFHTIIWPAMLMALDLPLPRQIFGHGWLLIDGGKMSKSKGNVVDPVVLCDRYGVDAVRYFLLREVPFGSDGVFTNEALIHRINADLANDLGNLVARSTAMADKYFSGHIPCQRREGEPDESLVALAVSTRQKVEQAMDSLQYSTALTELWKLVSRTNKYIDETAPWTLAKQGDTERLAAVMYNLCETIRIVAVLLTPFMPDTTAAIARQLSAEEDILTWESAGRFGLLPDGATILKGEPLFPRIDIEKEREALDSILPATADQADQPADQGENNTVSMEQISIDDFARVEMRVAKVIGCEPIKRAKRLLKLTLDDGSGTPRTVASGIADWYQPDDLINRHVVVVANLKPAVLCGVESQGMILAADAPDGSASVVFVDDIPVGCKLR